MRETHRRHGLFCRMVCLVGGLKTHPYADLLSFHGRKTPPLEVPGLKFLLPPVRIKLQVRVDSVHWSPFDPSSQ